MHQRGIHFHVPKLSLAGPKMKLKCSERDPVVITPHQSLLGFCRITQRQTSTPSNGSTWLWVVFEMTFHLLRSSLFSSVSAHVHRLFPQHIGDTSRPPTIFCSVLVFWLLSLTMVLLDNGVHIKFGCLTWFPPNMVSNVTITTAPSQNSGNIARKFQCCAFCDQT